MRCCKNCGWLRWITTTDTSYYCDFVGGEILGNLSDCCQEWKSAIQTNADKIRSMTDEELAKWFCSMCNFGDFCPYQDDCDQNGSGILKWMKEEAKDV